MEKFIGSLSKNKHHLLLVVLLTIFIVFEVPLPEFVSELVDNPVGKVAVAAASLCMLSVNPLVGVLSIIAAFVLIQRSSVGTGSFGLNNFLPTESKKSQQLNAMNDFPVSAKSVTEFVCLRTRILLVSEGLLTTELFQVPGWSLGTSGRAPHPL